MPAQAKKFVRHHLNQYLGNGVTHLSSQLQQEGKIVALRSKPIRAKKETLPIPFTDGSYPAINVAPTWESYSIASILLPYSIPS
jgi:hypothetical protein